MSPTLKLARELIQRASVTPDDQGCQELLSARLEALGFTVERLPFGDVQNIWARRGQAKPLFCYAGHTDVVPTGPLEEWTHPPFDATVQDGLLHGRGAADMKGSIAAFVIALEEFLSQQAEVPGSLALLITSDEEGPSINGTVKVVETLEQRQEHIDYCLVGEPSSVELLGDMVKNGRRGSLCGFLSVLGIQGHVAYPHKARNPIHEAAPALAALSQEIWDQGNDFFPATSFQISNINAGTGATNVVPGRCEVKFNFRFSTEQSPEDLQRRTLAILDAHKLHYEIRWKLNGRPFLTPKGPLLEAVKAAISEQLGRDTELSTSGGTSDGRFIAPTGAQVVELGLRNATIHKINEHIAVDDLEKLKNVYRSVLEKLFQP